MKRSDPVRPSLAVGRVPDLSPQLQGLPGLEVYAKSQAAGSSAFFFLARTVAGEQRLGLLASAGSAALSAFEGERSPRDGGQELLVGHLSHANALALRRALPVLRPRPLGLHTSAGCGDRLGLATPGHVRAAQSVTRMAGAAAPAMIFAQQSMREMARTGRTPDEVLDDATWGAFQEGWREGVGADADHLKSPADIDRCAAAGFTFYTIDPGDHVDSAADSDGSAALRRKYEALPWAELETRPRDLSGRYVHRSFDLHGSLLTLEEPAIVRAAVKYGRAVAHTVRMYRHLSGSFPANSFELEVSVDETETPTSHAEHLFIAGELRRLGVQWVSLAPRYVGRFEKGVDYLGDLAVFERDFAGHAAIAQLLGPYKLSLHSGSDKFAIYAIAARHARGLLHLKTAGTSYVEALRAVAGFDPALFRAVYAFAVERYPADRASYHVSADLARVPAIGSLPDGALPGMLDQFDVRQVLHVTYGSVLTSDLGFKERLLAGLRANSEQYFAILEKHFVRHLEPMAHRA